MRMRIFFFSLYCIITLLLLMKLAEANDNGKRIFMSNCISCHNKNPSQKGSVGPELTDTPLEVMRVKVTTGKYPKTFPKGYAPKRKTSMMRAFPKLEKDVPDIYAYIQTFKKK